MSETKHEEQVRLQNRTDELKREHKELQRRRPFDRAQHQKHITELKEHRANLARLRARLSAED